MTTERSYEELLAVAGWVGLPDDQLWPLIDAHDPAVVAETLNAHDPDWAHVDPLLAALDGQVVNATGIDRETGEAEEGGATFVTLPGFHAPRRHQP